MLSNEMPRIQYRGAPRIKKELTACTFTKIQVIRMIDDTAYIRIFIIDSYFHLYHPILGLFKTKHIEWCQIGASLS